MTLASATMRLHNRINDRRLIDRLAAHYGTNAADSARLAR